MPLYASGDSVPSEIVDMGNTSFTTKLVHGNGSSIMVAERPAGYHSRPHIHDTEQLNLAQAGELWIFIEERAFHLKKGDFLRIPAGKIHWSWNKGSEPCELFEVHTPGLQADPKHADFAVGLHDEGETPDYLGLPMNEFLADDDPFDPTIAESKSA